jgi:hypothetical protein
MDTVKFGLKITKTTLLALGNFNGQNMHIELPKSVAGGLLKEIVDRMQKKLDGTLNYRYLAYFAVILTTRCPFYSKITKIFRLHTKIFAVLE